MSRLASSVRKFSTRPPAETIGVRFTPIGGYSTKRVTYFKLLRIAAQACGTPELIALLPGMIAQPPTVETSSAPKPRGRTNYRGWQVAPKPQSDCTPP